MIRKLGWYSQIYDFESKYVLKRLRIFNPLITYVILIRFCQSDKSTNSLKLSSSDRNDEIISVGIQNGL